MEGGREHDTRASFCGLCLLASTVLIHVCTRRCWSEHRTASWCLKEAGRGATQPSLDPELAVPGCSCLSVLVPFHLISSHPPTWPQVLSQILRKARQRGLFVPNMKAQGVGAEATYEGATVSGRVEEGTAGPLKQAVVTH